MIKWPEPVLHQYRWTNPDGGEQPASMLEWKDIAPAWNQTVAQKCDELLAYRYKGKPVYEVRALVAEAQLKQAVRDVLEQAAKVAQETVCDTHTPTGINVYGTRAAKAIRALIEEIE